MRELEKEYTAYGYNFKQVKREGQIAIFEQRNQDSDKIVAYEVFVIQQLPEGFVGPKKYFQPAREAVPGKEQWGRCGWTIWHLEDAEKKFNELVARVAQRAEDAKS